MNKKMKKFKESSKQNKEKFYHLTSRRLPPL